MTHSIQLLIIDPQKDFMDDPQNPGALAVPGAKKDMQKLSELIDHHQQDLQEIYVTMDTHQVMDIAHPRWWVDEQGNHPTPFTWIQPKDVKEGRWKAARKEDQEESVKYVHQLAENNKYQLIIWPEHCLKGTPGHDIEEVLNQALKRWEQLHIKTVHEIVKGWNPTTEHYSGLKAEVPKEDDPSTQFNQAMWNQWVKADELWVAGEALSHCVANTVRDLVEKMTPEQKKKVIIIKDACSPVKGFEEAGADFLTEMKEQGVQVKETCELMVKKNNMYLKNM